MKKAALFLTSVFCFSCVFLPADLSAHSKEYQRRKTAEANARKAEADAERAKAQADAAKSKVEAEKLKNERQKNAPPKESVKTDWNAKMMNAVAKGNVENFKLALANGAELDANRNSWEGDTVLHIAVRANEIEFVKLLISEYKMNVNIKNFRMTTPLHLAAMAGYTDILRYLLVRNAEMELVTSGGMTAFQLAVLHGNVKAAKILREFGCTVPSGIERYAKTQEMKDYVQSLSAEKKKSPKKSDPPAKKEPK